MKAIVLMSAMTFGVLGGLAEAAPQSGQAKPTYEVKQGDSLAAIAREHGVSAAALAAENGIKNPALIQVGQKLRIPAKSATAESATARTPAATPAPPASTATGAEHIVASGDTLYAISRAHRISVAQLVALNPGADSKPLKIGQKLIIPATPAGATPVATAPATPTPPAQPTAPATAAGTVVAPEPTPTAPVAAPPATTPAPNPTVAAPTAAPTTPPAEVAPEPAAATPSVTLIKLTRKMTFAEFADEHQTTTEKLNTLNGWNLPPGAVLAPDSEFWVPKR
jgi:LysM repeat protein